MKKDDSILQGLKEYFKKATPEQLEQDWEEMKEYQDVGPSVEDYLKVIGFDK